MKNYLYYKIRVFIYYLVIELDYIYEYIKYLYICNFYGMINFFENLVLFFCGEELLDEMWFRWNLASSFYTELYYFIKEKLKVKYDDIKLVLIWKLKRNSHPIAKKICDYLNKYYWFRNNIIDLNH